MSNYYQECMDKIMMFIENHQTQEALRLIDEELSMIYIPQDFEEKLKTLKRELQPKTSKEVLTDEQLEEYIQKDEVFQLLAVKELSQRNLRAYLDLVQEIFNITTSELVKISLIEVCAEQQITEELQLMKDGLEISFIPSAITLPMYSDAVDMAIEKLEEWLSNEDPTFLKLCKEALMKEAYLHLPFEIDEEESETLAISIVHYVSKLMDCENSMKKTLSEKNASQNESFELLLYSNTI